MSDYTIGIDIGTTGTKVALLHNERGIVTTAARDSTLYSERPGFAEADTNQWLSNVIECIGEVLRESGVTPAEVGALSAAGMVPAVIFLDSNNRPLRRAILQNDARAVAEITELTESLNDVDIVSLTGSAITQQSVAPTVLWIQRNEPDVWSQTAHIVGSYDWVLIALGAELHVEWNWALESGLYTLDAKPFERVLDSAKLDPGLLPPVRESSNRVGTLNADMAGRTGLAPTTALIVGGADHVISAFSAGVENEGDALVKLGGAGDILAASNTPLVDARFYLDAHPIPGRWLPNGCMATSGSLIRWYQSIIGGTDLATLDAEAETRAPADVLCLPYFLGEKSPLNDPNLRGTFAGLHLGHTRADMYRSVLESIAFGFRHHVEIFAERGIALSRVMVTNGGSKSTLWKQIHSEVLGIQLHPVIDHPGASLGAAVIAAIGIGSLNDWADSKRFLELGEPVTPNARNVAVYNDAYRDWRDLGAAVTPISHSIAMRAAS
jgi:xylulokinase